MVARRIKRAGISIVITVWRHKPDLLLFRSIAGTGDLLGKDSLSIL